MYPMNPSEIPAAAWQKSSYSGDQGECVELAPCSRLVAVRDSKNPTSPALTFGRKDLRTFVAQVRGDAK